MIKWIHILTVLLLFTAKNSVAQFVEAAQCIGGSGNDIVADVQKTDDGGLIVLVNTNSADGDFADNSGAVGQALVKLNSQYEIEWKKSYGDSGLFSTAILIQHEGSYFLKQISINLDSNFYDGIFHLMKIDGQGNVVWMRNDSILSNSLSYILSLSGYSTFSFLRNNTIVYSVYNETDTSVTFYNLDANGTALWNIKNRYGDFYNDQNSMYGYNYILSSVNETDDNTIILTNTLDYACLWGCWGIRKSHFIKTDYSGNIINQQSSDTLINAINSGFLFKEDSSDLYFYSGSWNSIFALNKDSLKVRIIDNTIEGQFLNQQLFGSFGYIFQGTNLITNKPLFLIQQFDSAANTAAFYLQSYDLINNTVVYRSLLDTGGYINIISMYLLEADNYILIYAKGDRTYMARIDNTGLIHYNRILSQSIRQNEYIQLSYSMGMGFPNLWMPDYLRYGHVTDDKLYTYNFWYSYDTAYNYTYTQKFFIHNIETGNQDYEYINDMQDTLVYKYIAPYPDKKNELFVLSDLNGQNTCRLGGYDIMLSKVISATNKINGKAFIDYNNNNTKDSGEPAYGLAYLESSKGNNTISRYMYGYNYTTNFVDTGTWNTRLIPHHNYYEVQPDSFSSSHATFGNSDTVVFALHPKRTVNDLKVSLVNSFITRLGNTANYEIAYANEGTHTTNGTVKLVLDNRLNFATATPGISSQNGDTLIWYFTNLLVNETRKIIIHSNVPVPPVLHVGDSLHCIVFIEPSINDSTPNDNQAILDEVIPGSYDPNDKTATSGSTITSAQIQRGDYITYVVRFQNTGNDTAFRIVIEDTLDANLDWSTLQPLNTSHPFSMQVVNKNIIQFSFSNMKLPPASINEQASHGFVAYKVKPKADLVQGNTIKNTAHIYFDFNAPITTNTVNTQVVLLSAIKNNSIQDGEIKVYPNPNNGIFNLEFTANYTSPISVTLVDVTGRIVYQDKLQHQQKSIVSIDTQNLSGGLYSVVLKTDKEQITGKIIIDK